MLRYSKDFSFSLKVHHFKRLWPGVGHSGSVFSELHDLSMCSFKPWLSFCFWAAFLNGSFQWVLSFTLVFPFLFSFVLDFYCLCVESLRPPPEFVSFSLIFRVTSVSLIFAHPPHLSSFFLISSKALSVVFIHSCILAQSHFRKHFFPCKPAPPWICGSRSGFFCLWSSAGSSDLMSLSWFLCVCSWHAPW